MSEAGAAATGRALVVHLDRMTMGGVDIPRPDVPHDWVSHEFTEPDEVVERLRGARVAIINKVRLDDAILAQLPDLGLIAVTATGTDVVDSAAAARRGIAVRNVVGYAGTTVAEHVVMLLFALARGLVPVRQSVIDGRWENGRAFCVFAAPVRDLVGLRLGLFGSGAIAQGVASRARALGMEVVFAGRKGAAPPEGKLPFEEVLATSDIISLHCPLTDETRHMINAGTLAAMKPGAMLINTARGALVDEAALKVALESGKLTAAAIDVYEREPSTIDNPLFKVNNILTTPHTAAETYETYHDIGIFTAQCILDVFSGKTPQNLL